MRQSRSVLPILAFITLGHTAAPKAHGQVSVSLRGAVAQVQNNALVGTRNETVSGTWFGATLEVTLGPVALEFRNLMGSLSPGDNSAALAANGGEIVGLVRIQPTSMIALEGSYTLRRTVAVRGDPLDWKMPAAGVVFALPLGTNALRAYFKGIYSPGVRVTARTTPHLGIAAEAGIRAQPRHVPISLNLYYRFERFDFPAPTTTKVEQFDRLVVEFGFRLGQPRK